MTLDEQIRRSGADEPPRGRRTPRCVRFVVRPVWRLLSAGLLLASVGGSLQAQTPAIDPRQEYNVKAVYLYSFGRYVTWPKVGAEFVIGLLGGDPFGGALDQIAQRKSVQGRNIEVLRFGSMADYRSCDILFVSQSLSPQDQAAAIEQVRGLAVLVVGESPGFAAGGGTIGFLVDRDHVDFEINLEAAKQQGLVMDAKLLSLARVVKGAP